MELGGIVAELWWDLVELGGIGWNWVELGGLGSPLMQGELVLSKSFGKTKMNQDNNSSVLPHHHLD